MMHTIVTLVLVFVLMVTDVFARPEPLPMFLVNRAIKAAEVDVKTADQDVPNILVAEGGSEDTVPILQSLDEYSKTDTSKIPPVGKSQISIVKDVVENVAATTDLVFSLPVESKPDNTAGSEISIDQTEVNSPTDITTSKAKITSNNEVTSIAAGGSPSEDNEDQTASIAKKLLVKKAPTYTKPLKSRKTNKVVFLNRVRLLNSLIDLLLDSLIPSNDDFRGDRRTPTFSEYDYAFPSAPYDFNYF